MTRYVSLLKEYGLKATFQRIAILETIEKTGHMNVDEIYETVRQSHPTLSLATVYKNIVTMVEKGVLVEVPIVGHKSKYEIRKEEHIHLVCRSCGAVIDRPFDEELLTGTDAVAHRSAFVLEGRQINLYGLCADCREGESGADQARLV